MTSYAPPTFTPECISLTCDLWYAFNHNSDSYLHCVWLKTEIENTIEIAFNSMEHMMDEKFQNWFETGINAILMSMSIQLRSLP